MTEPRYDIFFSGEIMEGRDPEEVRSNIARMFKADEAKLNQLFSGSPWRIKSGMDQESASRYRVAFRQAGALVSIKPVVDQPQETSIETLTLLPPRSGDLSEFAEVKEPREIPDISAITLAAAGTDIDETPIPADADIDTSGLTLTPPKTGSLEDCQIAPEPAPIADISGLTLEEPEK